jgi:L-asparaginase II
MSTHPMMVAGQGRFDTRIMEVGGGRFLAKGGAEGYQGMGILPGVLYPGSPGIGIALKIADGDLRGKIRAAVAMEILNQMGVLSPDDLQALQEFGPTFPIYNWRQIKVGEGRPLFMIKPEYPEMAAPWRLKNAQN